MWPRSTPCAAMTRTANSRAGWPATAAPTTSCAAAPFSHAGNPAKHPKSKGAMVDRGLSHSSHWGAFSVLARGRGIEVAPHPEDPDPSALLGNIPAAVSHRARIARPMVRRGWLERGPAPDDRGGRDEFVPVTWSEALDLLAAELR